MGACHNLQPLNMANFTVLAVIFVVCISIVAAYPKCDLRYGPCHFKPGDRRGPKSGCYFSWGRLRYHCWSICAKTFESVNWPKWPWFFTERRCDPNDPESVQACTDNRLKDKRITACE